MAVRAAVVCPGCGLEMPASESATYDGYFNTSPECWSVFMEVIGLEFSDAVLFGAVHQLSVDTYAVDHAGGPHPDKSMAVHLSGLYLAHQRGLRSTEVTRRLKRLADTVEQWPHFAPPAKSGSTTVFDVAMADTPAEHITLARAWSRNVWDSWREHHAAVGRFVGNHLPQEGDRSP